MRRSLVIVLAIAFTAILCIPMIPMNAEAQSNTDLVIIKTDYQMLGFTDLHGGGHLTYELRGNAARDLRRAVLDAYDNMWTGGTNGSIDSQELRYSSSEGYIGELESYLETAHVEFFAGFTTSFSPLHQFEDISIDATGFTDVTNIDTDTNTPVRIFMYFNGGSSNIPYYDFRLMSEVFIEALFHPTVSTALDNNYIPYIDRDAYTYQYKHVDYRVSSGSFYNIGIDSDSGSFHVVRTPAGEVSTYSVTFQYNQLAITDSSSYRPFSAMENPQVLFVLVFICSYIMSTMPTRMYANYKYAYPRRFRHKALKIGWLHIVSKLMILFLILFYFFPTMFAFISPNLFMGGLFMWIICIICAFTFSILAKILYDRKAANIPEDHLRTPVRKVSPRPVPQPVTRTPAGVNVTVNQPETRQRQIARQPAPAPEPQAEIVTPTGPPCKVCDKPITDFVDLLKCKCGHLYHESCAEIAKHCTNCGSALVDIEPEGPVMNDIQCPTCGEMNSVEEGTDMLKVKCAACDIIMEKLDEGYNYLIVSNEQKTAFEMFVSMLKSGCTGLSISTTFPDKLRKEHDMAQSEVVWLTDTSVADKKTINPHRLEFEMMRMYASFVKNNPKSVIILDGFEYLVVENGFDKVFKFIKKINDLSSVNNATLFVPIGNDSLEPDQLGTLKKEFDKVVDMTDD